MEIIDFGFASAEVTEKNVKGMRLSVSENGTLKLTVPSGTPIREISDFVCQNESWILKTQQQKKMQYGKVFPNFTDDTISLWGVNYPVVYENGAEIKAELIGNVVRVIYPFEKKESKETVIFAVENLYFRELTRRLRERLPYWENVTGLFSTAVSVRKMTTRWGSCSTESRRIRLALNLAKKHPQCLDMVIVHELGHIIYPNHGTEFYQYMDLFYPDWKQAKQLLDQT